MQELDVKGVWWHPQSPNDQVAGTLKFNPLDGAVLEILGDNFHELIYEPVSSPIEGGGVTFLKEKPQIDILWGHTNKGDAVTLLKCRRGGENWATGYVGALFYVQVVFVGCHFENEADLIFDSMAIGYTNFETWLGITGFTSSFHRHPTEGKLKGELRYEQPDNGKFRVNDLTIEFCHSFSLWNDNFLHFQAKQTSYIEISPDAPMHYNDFHSKAIYPLRNFLSLAMGVAVLPLFLRGKNQNCFIETTDTMQTLQDVYVYYTPNGWSMYSEKRLNAWDMLFRYLDISENFEKHLRHWFEKWEKLLPVIDRYFGLLYIGSTYIQNEFITLTQAFEGYHRQMYGGQFMSIDTYKPTRDMVTAAIPDELEKDHKDSLKSRINYGYEYSLRKRLRHILTEILDPYKTTVQALTGDTNDFIKRLVDTRNFITHPSETPQGFTIADPLEQYNFVQKMKLLMQLCFFIELGFPAESVEKLMSENHKYKISLIRHKPNQV